MKRPRAKCGPLEVPILLLTYLMILVWIFGLVFFCCKHPIQDARIRTRKVNSFLKCRYTINSNPTVVAPWTTIPLRQTKRGHIADKELLKITCL
jgi:hypothetical protein